MACYIYLIIIECLYIVNAIQPQCPNNEEPKRDDNGRTVQCLPGDSFALSCGNNHYCYYYGMNYLCCPSNNIAFDDKLICPEPLITVLNANGYPLKCNDNNYECSKQGMFCMNIGKDFICCEKNLHKSADAAAESPKEADEGKCPPYSSMALDVYGNRILCDSSRTCLNNNQFCSSQGSSSICCQANSPKHNDAKTFIQHSNMNNNNLINTERSTDRQSNDTPQNDPSVTSQNQPIHQFDNSKPKMTSDAVKHFIRERIMNGWPYNDIYYHP